MIRNFLALFRRFKVATWLNILGLSVAFATFLIILLQVYFEYNYDRFHSTSSRIYRVDKPTAASDVFNILHPRPFVEEIIRFSPHIEAGTLLSFSGQVYLTVEGNGEKQGFRENVCGVHADFIKVFELPILQGDPDCLRDPEKVIIPHSLATKLFGDDPAVGKALRSRDDIWIKERNDFTVGAVYKDLPANTQLKNIIYTAINPDL